MARIHVRIETGNGLWTASTDIDLVACPHVGDLIDVNGRSVNCDVVFIGERGVLVREKRSFASEAAFLDWKEESGWE